MPHKMFIILCVNFLIWKCSNAEIIQTKDYFERIHPTASDEEQEEAVLGVISRLIPNHLNRFRIEISKDLPVNSFELRKDNNDTLVYIRAYNGVSACKGFHHYLKYYLKAHISWSGNQLNTIVNGKFPAVLEKSTSASRFIYYQNVCTWSYSFVWWKWEDWRRHIDWMAMMGISLSIAPIQEMIWTKIYRNIGLTEEEINEHFAGPAFQAWQRMGNMRGWAGPLTDSYKTYQYNLQKEIITAQRELGMIIAIPGFAGHVPTAFKRLFPFAKFTKVSKWARFQENYCCPLFIDPIDPLFTKIGEIFMKETIAEYGTDHIYFSDPFNELVPNELDSIYLAKSSSSIYEVMKTVDPEAIWLLQGWMFLDPIWKNDYVRSFLTAVPRGRILILDLMSEQYPQYERTNSYYGQPFIWCMLHNFGGTLGMHGSIHTVNTRISLTRNIPGNSMVGVGITPEGINQNYVLYEFALERGWVKEDLNLDLWFDQYVLSRYGRENKNLSKSWKLLKDSVYSYNGIIKLHGKYTVARRPSLQISPFIWYQPEKLLSAFENFLEIGNDTEIEKNHLYRHDLVDISRQFLQVMFDVLFIKMKEIFENKDRTEFEEIINRLLAIFLDYDDILKTNEKFLLGQWIGMARNLTNNTDEKDIFEFNARNQITLWGPNGEIVDYATKQWSGTMMDYFRPRWMLFVQELKTCLELKKNFNEKRFRKKVYERIEKPFTLDRFHYPIEPEGDTVMIAKRIFRNWIEIFKELSEVLPIRPDGISRAGGRSLSAVAVDSDNIPNEPNPVLLTTMNTV